MNWKRWLALTGGLKSWPLLFLIWLIVPGGTIAVIAWLLVKEVHIDKKLANYCDTRFGEFIEPKRTERRAKDKLSGL